MCFASTVNTDTQFASEVNRENDFYSKKLFSYPWRGWLTLHGSIRLYRGTGLYYTYVEP